MAQTAVRLSTSGGRAASATLDIVVPTPLSKGLRALGSLVGFWLAAACTVPLVVLHFLTVPALLLAGLVRFVTILRSEFELKGGEAPCPACGTTLPTGKGFRRWPLETICTDCGRPVELVPAEGSPHPSQVPGTC